MEKHEVYLVPLISKHKNTIPNVKTLILTLFNEKGVGTTYKTQKEIIEALNEHFPDYKKQREIESEGKITSICDQPAVSKALKELVKHIYDIDDAPFRIKLIDGEYTYVKVEEYNMDVHSKEIISSESFNTLCEIDPFESDVVIDISEKMYAYHLKENLDKAKKTKTKKQLTDMFEGYIFDIFYHSNKMYIVTNNRINKNIQKKLTELPTKVNDFVRNKKKASPKKPTT